MVDNQKHIHFIGILGSGMSGLAMLFLQYGFKISGSDVLNENNHSLPKWLHKDSYTHTMNEGFINKADIIIYSTAIPQDHNELVYARQKQKEILHRSEAINIISKNKRILTIAGTHGKTTTSSLLAWIFKQTKHNPSYLIGGDPIGLTKASYNDGIHFITEADESDSSFLNYPTDLGIVINVEADHLEKHNNSFSQYKEIFLQYIKKSSKCIINIDNPVLNEFVKILDTKNIITFGKTSEADFKIYSIHAKNLEQTINLVKPDGNMISIQSNLMGSYNAENIISAWIAGHLEGISDSDLHTSISSFQGVKRRCQTIGITKKFGFNTIVLDDYGHHPSECHAVLKELKRQGHHVIHIFQPHRFTRLNNFFDDFKNALKLADLSIITDVYTAGETQLSHQKCSNQLIKDLIIDKHNAYKLKSDDDFFSILQNNLNANSIILFQGAGTISEMAHMYLQLWNQN